MLNTLLPLKDFCATCVKHGNIRLKLSADYWEKIKEIRQCLEPCYRATKKLQYRNNTLTDIYKIWHMCHIQTGEIGIKLMHYFFFKLKGFY